MLSVSSKKYMLPQFEPGSSDDVGRWHVKYTSSDDEIVAREMKYTLWINAVYSDGIVTRDRITVQFGPGLSVKPDYRSLRKYGSDTMSAIVSKLSMSRYDGNWKWDVNEFLDKYPILE